MFEELNHAEGIQRAEIERRSDGRHHWDRDRGVIRVLDIGGFGALDLEAVTEEGGY